jgi:hypothetical protein
MTLTILTVNYFSVDFLKYNIELTKKLNPNIKHNWIIIDNETSDLDSSCIKSLGDLQDSKVNVNVIAGKKNNKNLYKTGGFHHAKGLHIGLDCTPTNGITLVLDPDFYILKKNWIKEILLHIANNNLSLLGAPWNPKWYRKIRYFPTIHCLFINFDRVSKDDVDFYPGELKNEKMPISNYVLKFLDKKEEDKGANTQLSPSVPAKEDSKKSCTIKNLMTGQLIRFIVKTSLDTGWGIYKKFHDNPKFKWSSFIPVFNPVKDYPLKCFINFNLLLDRLLPERFSLIPKEASFISSLDDEFSTLLKDENFYSELFFFNKVIWGVHFRNQRGNMNPEYESIKKKLDLIINLKNNSESHDTE